VLCDHAVESETQISQKDLKVEWFSGTGKGGQHRNKHQNSCRLTHIPTGITTTSQQRKRTQSYNSALQELTARVTKQAHTAHRAHTDGVRQQQTGTGMRADKIRTYRFQDDTVKDHNTGRTAKASHVMRGKFQKLWQ
jgi:peptide chain release factor 1